jgi:hypothetical protein
MNDRDTFAAAALTGLLAGRVPPYRSDDRASYAESALALADAMLAARGTTTDHDAAPAATASEAEKQAVCRRAETIAGEAGTGDTRAAQEPAAWAVIRDDVFIVFYITRAAAQEVALAHGWTVLPLYAAPPAAGVTLTDAEREAVAIAQMFYAHECETDGVTNEDVMVALTLRGLLARAAKEGGR